MSVPGSLHRALGNAVRERRRDLGLSLEDLADRAALSASYLGQIERGERDVSMRILWQLADGLGVSASGLLGEAERSDSAKESETSPGKED